MCTCFCFLLVAMFSMAVWLFSHDTHAFHEMLGYFVYAGAAYALVGRDLVLSGHAQLPPELRTSAGKLPLAGSPAFRSPGMPALSRRYHRSGGVPGPSLTYDRPGRNSGQCP